MSFIFLSNNVSNLFLNKRNPMANSTQELPLLFSTAALKLKYSADHQHSSSGGVLTPPLHSSLASVPFKWEEQPGKPRPSCTHLINVTTIFNEPKCLEPPPRLYYLYQNTKTPSPATTILQRRQLGNLVVSKNKVRPRPRRGYCWWQRFVIKGTTTGAGRNNSNETAVGGGNFVISSASPCVKTPTFERNGSFTSATHASSRIWSSIYEGFKQAVIPWKGKKSKKEVFIKTQALNALSIK
ncbi:hypothetical protein HAX54_012646 [Datura stramonium]|uniref:Uncharacterized protein n=1 Tax=Datura stramonium TaxID=4076 RepID=A0ABS8TMU5_DATST|nr:hypothetical protein [Datura stramonium]